MKDYWYFIDHEEHLPHIRDVLDTPDANHSALIGDQFQRQAWVEVLYRNFSSESLVVPFAGSPSHHTCQTLLSQLIEQLGVLDQRIAMAAMHEAESLLTPEGAERFLRSTPEVREMPRRCVVVTSIENPDCLTRLRKALRRSAPQLAIHFVLSPEAAQAWVPRNVPRHALRDYYNQADVEACLQSAVDRGDLDLDRRGRYLSDIVTQMSERDDGRSISSRDYFMYWRSQGLEDVPGHPT